MCRVVTEMDPPRSKRLKCQEIVKSGTEPVPIVALTRLPDSMVNAQCPPALDQDCSEAESLSGPDMWIPGFDSSDSDFCPEKFESKVAKSRKLSKKKDKTKAASQRSTTNNHKNDAAKSSVDKTTATTTKRIAATLPSTTHSGNQETKEQCSIIVSSAFSPGLKETTTVRPKLQEIEFKVGMAVLARRRPMRWIRGKLIAIVERENGKLKYKVSFDENGKSLVSAHHLAFCSTAKLDELYIGARVVVESREDKSLFLPGILAELPSRKNRLRFLVFMDDHTPVYVGLQLLHLICKPLENALDDLPDGKHKCFLKQYLKNWPYPHLTQYKIGQRVFVEGEGEMQKCEVTAFDSSLMQIVFPENQQKEWIYRGSIRIEHIANFLALREKAENKDKPKMP